jgi:hypothetical protein
LTIVKQFYTKDFSSRKHEIKKEEDTYSCFVLWVFRVFVTVISSSLSGDVTLEARSYGMDQEPRFGSHTVRVDVAPCPLHRDHLAQDLLCLYGRIQGAPRILTKDKAQSIAPVFFYPHNAMCHNIVIGAIKDDIAQLNILRLHRLHGDSFVLSDGGIHAPARGSEPDTLPAT